MRELRLQFRIASADVQAIAVIHKRDELHERGTIDLSGKRELHVLLLIDNTGQVERRKKTDGILHAKLQGSVTQFALVIAAFGAKT